MFQRDFESGSLKNGEIKKVREYIEKHIDLWRKERDGINERISEFQQAINRINSLTNHLDCKRGLAPEEMICIGCVRARPEFVRNRFVYPGGQEELSFTEEDGLMRDCESWERKKVSGACGCSGKYICICGYSESFCRVDESKSCPFCGRECAKEFFQSPISIFGMSGYLNDLFGNFKDKEV